MSIRDLPTTEEALRDLGLDPSTAVEGKDYTARDPEWVALRDVFRECEHEHWFKDETPAGEQIHVCEDCDEFVYVSDLPKCERQEP